MSLTPRSPESQLAELRLQLAAAEARAKEAESDRDTMRAVIQVATSNELAIVDMAFRDGQLNALVSGGAIAKLFAAAWWQTLVVGHGDREMVITSQMQASHANEKDATEQGAYAVAVLASSHAGFRVRRRVHQGSGADLLMTRKGEPDNDFFKLEVSGIAREGALDARLAAKVDQVGGGDLDRPGVAVVVGFQAAVVLMAERFNDARATIRALAEKDLASHVVRKLGEGEWYCGRLGSGMYWFRVIVRPGVVIVWGDIGDWIISHTDPDSLGWLRRAAGDYPDYLWSKVRAGKDESFYPGDALDYLKEMVCDDASAERLRDAETLARSGDLDEYAWHDFVAERGIDLDCHSVGTKPGPGMLWLAEAMKWFVANVDKAEAA